jgi:hypothetical protein
MKLPLFFPNPTYVPKLPRRGALPLAEVCALADVACRATGRWTERLVIMDSDEKLPQGAVWAEPGGGTVRVVVPAAYRRSARARARYALGVLAYVLFDLVSRESIRGKDWAAIRTPVGRPRAARALSSAERQRRFRLRRRPA